MNENSPGALEGIIIIILASLFVKFSRTSFTVCVCVVGSSTCSCVCVDVHVGRKERW